MSLAIKYETVEDAKMRLRNSIVLYKGDPVYIRDVMHGAGGDEILRVLFDELPLAAKPPGGIKIGIDPAEDAKRKYISSKHFDIAPFKLGYINRPSASGAFYCSRMPNRIQKQGLCMENFKATDNFGANVGFDTFLRTKEMAAMVRGDYPTFEQAVRAIDKVKAVAFNREFCLVKDEVIPDLVFLYHKGVKVGMYTDNKVTLGNKFNCLKESLQEMKLRVGAF